MTAHYAISRAFPIQSLYKSHNMITNELLSRALTNTHTPKTQTRYPGVSAVLSSTNI
jgi:hypothetical protein